MKFFRNLQIFFSLIYFMASSLFSVLNFEQIRLSNVLLGLIIFMIFFWLSSVLTLGSTHVILSLTKISGPWGRFSISAKSDDRRPNLLRDCDAWCDSLSYFAHLNDLSFKFHHLYSKSGLGELGVRRCHRFMGHLLWTSKARALAVHLQQAEYS